MSLKQLTKNRNTLKQKLIIFEKYVNSINAEDAVKPSLAELEYRISRWETLITEFDNIQTEIESKCEDSALPEHYGEREDFESKFDTLMGFLKQLLKDSIPIITPNNSQSSNNNQPIEQLQTTFLPKIKLPVFKGDFEHWLEFKTNFLSIVHNNSLITKANKYNFLRTSVDGYAKRIIEGIDFVEDQYEAAWALLCKRFDKKRVLVNNHVKAIFSIEPIQKENAQAYRKLLDEVTKHLTALKILKLSNSGNSDIYLMYLINSKLDKGLQKQWEEYKPANGELPTLDEFFEFLGAKADALENWQSNQNMTSSHRDTRRDFNRGSFRNSHSSCSKDHTFNKNEQKNHSSNHSPNNYSRLNLAVDNIKCNFCKGNHVIYTCSEFLKLNPSQRLDKIRGLNLCVNCLRIGHNTQQCSLGNCKRCNEKHNTLLHTDASSSEHANLQISSSSNQSNSSQLSTNLLVKPNSSSKTQVLLSTVVVKVQDSDGKFQKCRAILDSGAQSNLVTQDFCNRLNISLVPTNLSIIGINQAVSNLTKKCSITIFSNFHNFEDIITCYVVPVISSEIPSQVFSVSNWKIPQNLNLADPDFSEPGEVNMLIGASLFWNLLIDGKIELGKNLPVLHNTKLGWVISGTIPISSKKSDIKSICNFSKIHSPEDEQLKHFWEIEEVSVNSAMSKEELECEQLFACDTFRNEEGQFVVKFPFKHSPSLLGNSLQTAIKRFYSLERKFVHNQTFKSLYVDFINEYKALGHMCMIQGNINADNNNVGLDSSAYYLPHHGIFKEHNITTKLRVVFDGSCPTSTGWSLNDLQYIGPKIQNDIFHILLRFRQYTYVVSADINKMYRQIIMNPEHRPLQRIIWRENSNNDFSIFELNTVTYGTAAAPYLAIKCLKQLAVNNSNKFPVASKVILTDFYVDDLLTGSNDINDLKTICRDVSFILQEGNFVLRKWISNHPAVISDFSSSNIPSGVLNLSEHESSKTLGIQWLSQSDLLTYKISEFQCTSNSLTKRQILSHISQIYDPLGLLSPCIIISKIIIQRLWSLKMPWDEPIPDDLFNRWKEFHTQLIELNNLRIPRHAIGQNCNLIDIHCFCDASRDAYASCIYSRSKNPYTNEYQVNLLCAKTKVAPIKTITIPRLELCAALLGAQLMKLVTDALSSSVPVFYWSDSQVVLAWLKLESSSLQIFVANRISKIQTLTNINNWYYIPSKENPADVASRGIQPRKLANCTIWWHGPNFLKLSMDHWPITQSNFSENDLPELRGKTKILTTKTIENCVVFSKFSSLNKLRKVTAYCFRFLYNSRVDKSERKLGPLSVTELEGSFSRLIKISQLESFGEEITYLKSHSLLPKGHKLSTLAPFLDLDNILRVGGRLRLTSLDYDVKHPILLCSKHNLTKLILQDKHISLLHAGPQLLLSSIRQKYWPIGGRNLARKTVKQCITCFKFNPVPAVIPMAALPEERIKPSLPFQYTGIDYAGPFLIKDKKGRGSRLIKCYICIFICFCTKALHLEIVSNLTSENFIACLHRFTSRRGRPSHIYSDNGTTFVGAHNELKELGQFLSKNQTSIFNSLVEDGITWHFIPPYSPNFGGLWEAAVKSTKYHLKRTMLNISLTYEEFNTLTVQVEGILNSRPLFAMSNDPNDLNPITPSHFLIGRIITCPPEGNLTIIPPTKLSTLQRIQKLKQQFWQRFSLEYVTQLHKQYKWKDPSTTLSTGTLVLIRNDQLPSCKWALGRIQELIPGKDGLPRVAIIQVSQGLIKRSTRHLCPLPLQEDTDN